MATGIHNLFSGLLMQKKLQNQATYCFVFVVLLLAEQIGLIRNMLLVVD